MTQRTTGPYRLVGVPFIYKTLQRLLAGPDALAEVVGTFVKPPRGGRILDLGCGPANIVPLLPPDCEYVGIDANPRHIEAARDTHGARGTFLCGDFSVAQRLDGRSFDLVTMFGLLHHLDDEAATAAIRIARAVLDPAIGRLFAIDPCLAPGQHPLARFLINRDSGQAVRTEAGYRSLAADTFETVETTLRHDLLNVPYTHCIMTGLPRCGTGEA